MKRFLDKQEWILVIVGFVFLAISIAVAGLYNDQLPLDKASVYYVSSEEMNELKSSGKLPESKKLNINTASKEELMALDGIGEKTAQNIISKREQVGGFKELEDLLLIDGIGEKKYRTLEPYLYCE